MKNLNDGVLILEEGTEEISERQYYENNDIVKIVFPSTLRCIETEAFAGCKSLEELVFNDNLVTIGAGAFYENINLKKVVFNNHLESIADGAFLDCQKLQYLKLPLSLKEIGSMAFYACNLKHVDIPINVSKIGDQAFWNNENLKEVNILNPKCDIGLDVFGSCYQLNSGYIAPGYPLEMELYDELLYSILALSTYEKHEVAIQEIVKEYAKENLKLLMEKILESNNAKALNTLINLKLLDKDINQYLKLAFSKKRNELIALLLKINNNKEDLSL